MARAIRENGHDSRNFIAYTTQLNLIYKSGYLCIRGQHFWNRNFCNICGKNPSLVRDLKDEQLHEFVYEKTIPKWFLIIEFWL